MGSPHQTANEDVTSNTRSTLRRHPAVERDGCGFNQQNYAAVAVLVNTGRQLMSCESPTPPADLPREVVNTLNESTPERLRHIARYAEELAEHKERKARLREKSDEDDIKERPDDLPDDVPVKATITIKEINDNRYYYYWQWREGDKVTSKYKAPVNPDE